MDDDEQRLSDTEIWQMRADNLGPLASVDELAGLVLTAPNTETKEFWVVVGLLAAAVRADCSIDPISVLAHVRSAQPSSLPLRYLHRGSRSPAELARALIARWPNPRARDFWLVIGRLMMAVKVRGAIDPWDALQPTRQLRASLWKLP